MRALLRALVLALAGSSLSGCFCITNMAVVGLDVGQPANVDRQQPESAIEDIAGLSARQEEAGYRLHVNARLEDGRTVHLVSSVPSTATGEPSVVSFVPAKGPFPPPEFPIVVPDWSWGFLDGRRRAAPGLAIGVGSPVHRTDRAGAVAPELTRMTAGLAATCGYVTIHLVRDPGLRRQTWQLAFYPPREGRIALLTQDSDLYGPLPPEGTLPKTIVFAVLSPVLVSLDLALWVSGIGMAVEFPLGWHFGWIQDSPPADAP